MYRFQRNVPGAVCTDTFYGSSVGPQQRYGCYTLQKGDNDAKRIWGGVKRGGGTPAAPGAAVTGPVTTLQTDLKAFGVYTLKVDGDFGKGTEDALKRFQWNAQNVPVRLKGGLIHAVGASGFLEAHSGRLTDATLTELLVWIAQSYKATGDLVRLKRSSYSNIKLGPGFTKIGAASSVTAGEFVLSRDAVADVKAMNVKAVELGVTLSLNQCFRLPKVRVSGAVVKPARYSQHLIGHAIDLNILDGTSANLIGDFLAKNETENAKTFIKAMKDNGMRWGGDWSGDDFDPPHYDRQVLAGSDAFDFKYFFNQRMFSESQPIPAAGA